MSCNWVRIMMNTTNTIRNYNFEIIEIPKIRKRSLKKGSYDKSLKLF